ncbi:MAG TPA: DUF1697 domain-containing protein [Rhizobacter sp.]|nr:DUF1697 domain-containing protein [Rhizobacter sp.]
MPRYVALLRGVSPLNAKMPELKRVFETAGFTEVRTLLSSGNVVFDARSSAPSALEKRAERAMLAELGHSFGSFVRPLRHLQALLDAQPFAAFKLPPQGKCVVTFLRQPLEAPIALPPERDGARILKVEGSEVFSVYVPGDKGPVFMNVLERTFGKDITTRTLDTVTKCARA